MHILTEQQKKAIPAVLECGLHGSQEDAAGAAISAIESALGTDSQESHRMLDDLQRFHFVETQTGTTGELAPLRFKVRWRLTKTGYELLKSEAKAWIERQFKAE